ncbi:MAG: MFS transporter [Pontibacterium sp.]
MNLLIKKFFLSIIVPSSIFAVVQQALLVILPLYILENGGTLAASAAVIGIKGLGMMLSDIPAGMLLSRIGDKRLMQGGIALFVVSVLLMVVSSHMMVLIFAAVLQGFAHGAWLVGRISFIPDSTEVAERGRVMGLTAGTIRFGNMLGPLMAGFMLALVGYQATLVACAILSIVALVAVCVFIKGHPPCAHDGHHIAGLVSSLKENRHVFLTAGVGAVALMFVRSSRALLLPLVGAALMLDEASIGIAVTAGAVIDTLLFYPAGSLMDRIGRKPVFVASLVILGIGLLLLPLAQGFWGLCAISLLLGLGNGISAGVIMTVGADLAPRQNRGSFIGVWRLLSDVGVTSGPFVIGGVIKLLSLSAASSCIGVLGVMGGIYMASVFVETNNRKR